MSDRFKNKPKAKKLCSRINSLREWLHKGDGLGMQFIIDNYIDSLGVKEPLTNKEKDYIKKGYEYLKQTSYSQSYIDWILKRDFETTDINQALDQVRLVFEDDEYHFVNKLNTNYSDLAELITQMFIKVDDSKEMYTTAFGERGIADVSDEELKEGLLRVKDRFGGILNDKFTFDDIKTYVNNSKRNSDFGDSGENIVANFLKDQDFDVVFQGGDGNFIDMKFGVDLIVYKDGRFYSIQVKPNNPNKWLSSKRYKNVDWIVTYVGGVNIFANKKGVVNGEEYQSGGVNNITPYVTEKKSLVGDDLIESFIDTGKFTITEKEELYGGTINVAGEEFNFADVWKMFYPESDYYENLNHYRWELKKIVLRYTEGNEQKAKDIYDEVFLRNLPSALFKKGGKVFKELHDLYKYIYLTMLNEVKTTANKEKKEREKKQSFDPEIYYDDNKERQEQKNKLIDAINSIDDFKKRYVLIGRLGGTKFEEIVDEWNETYPDEELTLGAAKMIFKRSLPQLKDFIENIDESIENFFDTGKLL